MSVDPVVAAAELDDEQYDSAEDEDFQLDAAPDDSDLSSDNDDAEPATKKRKTDKKAAAPIEELDSGDEITIQKAKDKRDKRRRKKAKGKSSRDDDDLDLDDDDEGGTGGFVRTRAMKEKM